MCELHASSLRLNLFFLFSPHNIILAMITKAKMCWIKKNYIKWGNCHYVNIFQNIDIPYLTLIATARCDMCPNFARATSCKWWCRYEMMAQFTDIISHHFRLWYVMHQTIIWIMGGCCYFNLNKHILDTFTNKRWILTCCLLNESHFSWPHCI